MQQHKLSGLGVALVTPFEDNHIDYGALRRMTRHVIDGSVDFIVALGSTGEALTLAEDEKRKVLDTILDENGGRCPVWTGHLAGSHTESVLKGIDDMDRDGIAGIMISTPAYNKPNQRGLQRHFLAIADRSDLPVMMYNVPSRTGVNMNAETCLQLAEHPNIVALKEAGSDWSQINEILRARPTTLAVLSGDDPTALPFIANGGDGLISVLANAFPSQMKDLVTFALDQDLSSARKIHYDLWPYHDPMYSEGNPTGLKTLLELLRLCNSDCRLPLIQGSQELKNQLSALIKR